MQSIIRIILLLTIISIVGYIGYQNPQLIKQVITDPWITQAVNTTSDKVKGATSSLNLDTNKLLNSAARKLTDSQLITSDDHNPDLDSDQPPPPPDFQEITNNITKQLKDIPKNQAKEIVSNVCEQMINNLDKEE